MHISELVKRGQFVVTCEVDSPKGVNFGEMLDKVDLIKNYVDAINIGDNQRAVMRAEALSVCHLLKTRDVETVMEMTTRDRNRIAIQSELLGAAILGIENILLLDGDHPSVGDHTEAKPVYDLDSVTLLNTISRLNEGCDINGNELQGKPAFFPGAVVKVESDTEASMELQLIKMERKIAAGARCFQTQAVYDAEHFAKFMKRVERFKIPILAGVIPLKSAGMARFMNKNVSGVYVPEELIQKMVEAEDKTQTGIEIAADLIKQLKSLCQGVHIMAIGWEKKVPSIIKAAGL